MDKNTTIGRIEIIPTGSISLDRALGVKGYPRGRIIEVYGPESSGKSTMALLACAQVQKMGGKAAYIDVEHSFSKSWAMKLGVDVNTLLISQPDYGEQALEIMVKLGSTNELDLIVLDSTAALVPKAELDAEIEKESMGLQARMMSKALRKLTTIIGKSKTVAIFINQTRQKIGVMFGDPTTTPGGLALKFYCSQRIAVAGLTGQDNVYKDSNDVRIGHRLKLKVQKNKVAAPFRECEFDLYFDSGVDNVVEVSDLSIDLGLTIRSGKTVTYKDKQWCGIAAYIKALREDAKLFKEIKDAVLSCPI